MPEEDDSSSLPASSALSIPFRTQPLGLLVVKSLKSLPGSILYGKVLNCVWTTESFSDGLHPFLPFLPPVIAAIDDGSPQRTGWLTFS